MKSTAITLIVNGQIEDYNSHLKKVVGEVLSDFIPQLQANSVENGFKIIPQMAYKLDSPEIVALFGCQDIKNPVLAIATRLRAVGIEPETRGRSGSVVFGWQIDEYVKRITDKTHSFLKPN